MKQLLTIPVLCIILAVQLKGQAEIFEGLFGKEEPEFHASVSYGPQGGSATMTFYFTHPSLDKLEASFWVKDLGPNLMSSGEKRLVKGLQEFGNRQQAEIVIDGLKSRHFYTIGIDYRGTSSLSRKFSSKVLEESFHYESKEEPAPAYAAQPPVQQPKAPAPEPQPCKQPNFFIKVEPAGYCGVANRPAVLIQCDNCQGMPWSFSVEARTGLGQWRPLRSDGKKQQALGVAPRTEPLCSLEPGEYYFRVLAWGDKCSDPVIQTVGTSVRIPGEEELAAPLLPPTQTAKAAIPSHLPDTCIIESEAKLEGDLITGFIELDPASPCSAYHPFAKVRYVHPGYRDITVGQVALVPGEDVPFRVRLDSRDLSRGIHPLQVLVCIRPQGANKEIPISSFWIRAESAAEYRAPGLAMEEMPSGEKDDFARWKEEQAAYAGEEAETPLTTSSAGVKGFGRENFSENTAACQQIEGLQLIYVPERPGQPLYISWQNPDCCQDGECEYMVWAGPGAEDLKLLVKGRKPETSIRELIQGVEEGTAYYEIAVRTPGGIRKAAYVLGEGPKYGDEMVQAYHQQAKEPVLSEPEALPATGVQLSGGLAARAGGRAVPASNNYQHPKHPISEFAPCRIFRATQVIAEKPIQDGDLVTIEYDFYDKAYRYSLYHLPEGGQDWVIAPGTEELQSSPAFEIQAQPFHSGKHLVLAIKQDESWGCLSAPVDEPIEIQVLR